MSEAHLPSDREIVITREVGAPRERVWKVWTNPEHLAKWWGPVGFTTTTVRMDVRAGGDWRYVMHGPDGHDYQNLVSYLDVVEPERLVYKHGGGADAEPVSFHVTVTFEPVAGRPDRTRVTLRSTFPTPEARDHVIQKYNAVEGGKQTLGRLDAFLAELADSATFVIQRVVRASRELVYQTWTQSEHLARWFGPKGCTLNVSRLDPRPGGEFLYEMKMPNGAAMWGKWVFRELSPGARLVFVSTFSNEAGDATRAPFNADWPLETLTTVTFVDHAGIGKGTVVTVESTPLNASDAERRVFADFHASMTQGWSGTFDQLEAHVGGLATPGA